MSQAVRVPPTRPWLLQHTGAFVVLEAAVILAAVYFIARSWMGLGLGIFVITATLLFILPLSHGQTLGQVLGRRWAYGQRHPRSDVRPDALQPLAEWLPRLTVTDTQTGRGEEIGVIFDGDAWTAVLAVIDDDEIIAEDAASARLSLTGLDELTAADDILFDGLQVVTHVVGAPAELVLGPRSPLAAAYAELGAPTPPAVRSTWIAVRLDPRRCLAAVTRRGPSNHDVGPEGPLAALRFGLHRVQSQLKLRGLSTRFVDAAEVRDVLARVGSGADGTRGPKVSDAGAGSDAGVVSDEDWETWACDGFTHVGRSIRDWGEDPDTAYGDLVRAAADAPVLWGVVAYTVGHGRAATGAVRLVAADADATIDAVDAVCDGAADAGLWFDPPGGLAVPVVLGTVPLGRRCTP